MHSLAAPAFYIHADSGQGIFTGGVSVGSSVLPPSNGLYVSGKVGIGIQDPQVKLHITGGNNVSLTDGGTIVTGPLNSNNVAIDNDEIQARNNGAADKLLLNKNGGNVGIGTASPIAPLNIDGCGALSLKGGGFIVAGSLSAYNLGISNGAIQARDNGAGSLLTVNKDGGDVMFGGSVGIGGTPSARLHVVLGTEATLSDGGYIVAGLTALNNIVIDNAGIQARNNGQAQVLNLNPHGGTIYTPGALQTGSLLLNEDMIDFGVGRGPGFRSDLDHTTIKILGNFRPSDDGLWGLGSSFKRWTEVWSLDGSINTSDERDKTNIKDINYGLKEIMKLRSVRFNWKDKIEKGDKLGLIAQELQKVLPEVVRDYEYKTNEQTGERENVPAAHLGVMYADIIPVLIRAIQEQQKEIEELKAHQSSQSSTLNQSSQSLTLNNQSNATAITLSSASLEQNIPNPLNNTTTIRYTIPANAKNAKLVITDISGKTIKQLQLSKQGTGTVTIDASALQAGTYNYTLIVDGKNIETKSMIVAR